MTPVIVDFEGTFRVEVLDGLLEGRLEPLSKIIVSRELTPPTLGEVVIMLHPKPSHILRERRGLVAFCRRGELGRVKGFKRLYVRRFEENKFVLEGSGKRLRLEIRGLKLELWKPKLQGHLAAAYKALQIAITEYGPLSFSDSTTVVSASLKISREYARRIIRELVRLGVLEVVEGSIFIS